MFIKLIYGLLISIAAIAITLGISYILNKVLPPRDEEI